MIAEPTADARRRIIESFSKAAIHYDDQAVLQRDVADALLRRLPEIPAPVRVADIGCGTGYVTARLRERFAHAQLLGIDPAPGMLVEAARRHGHTNLHWQLGEAEALPVETASLDMIVSSLAIQWCASPEGFLVEAARTLRPKGWLAFTTLGEGSLGELKAAFQRLNHTVHVNDFLTESALAHYLRHSPLSCRHVEWADHRAFHENARASLKALKAIGASTVPQRNRQGLMSRARWARLIQALEIYRTQQGLPTTYRVAFVLMQKPDHSH